MQEHKFENCKDWAEVRTEEDIAEERERNKFHDPMKRFAVVRDPQTQIALHHK